MRDRIVMKVCVRLVSALVLGLATTVSGDVARAQIVSSPELTEAMRSFHGPDLVGKDGAMAKIGFDLTLVFHEHRAAVRDGLVFEPSNSMLQVDEGRVALMVVPKGESSLLASELRTLGMEISTALETQISGSLSIADLDRLAAMDGVNFARASYRPLTHVGSVTSEGDAALKTNAVRAIHGVDGSGFAVGVISDSFDNGGVGSASDDVATGDLPMVTVLDDSIAGTDEGRAMLQLVHDVAPGSALLFHTAGTSQADFASAISDLHTAGADVIVDDILFLAEPMFMDGVIAQAVDVTFAAGVPYFSAAGNSGRHSYETPFVTSGMIGPLGGMLHDFGGGDTCQTVTFPAGVTILVLQWDEPFKSVCGDSCAGSASDLDFYLILGTASIGLPVASAITSNIGADAVEVLPVIASSAVTVCLAIELLAGPAPEFLKYVAFSPLGFSIDEYGTESSTLYGHANANGAMAVGAVDDRAYGPISGSA